MKDALLKTLFLLGTIILIIAVIFGIVHFFKSDTASSIFNSENRTGTPFSLFGNNDEISLEIDKNTLVNGDEFHLSWPIEEKLEGAFKVTHSCVENIKINIKTPNGLMTLICDVPFPLPPRVTGIDLIPTLNKPNSFTDVDMIVTFVEKDQTEPSLTGKVTINLQNQDQPSDDGATSDTNDSDSSNNQNNPPTDNSNNANSATSTPPTTTYTGPADLLITDLKTVGSGVSFTVTNNGGENSGQWKFDYSTPTSTGKIFTSPTQVSLKPGQSLKMNVSFREAIGGSYNIKIDVDSTNLVTEKNESNNTATITLNI